MKPSTEILDCFQKREIIFISLLSFFKIICSVAVTPADDGKKHHTLLNRLIEYMSHLAGNTEGPKLP